MKQEIKEYTKTTISTPSLSELREALEPEETSPFDKEIFERAFEYMERFHSREISLNHHISQLYEQLDELDLSMERLPPMDIAEILELLKKELEATPDPLTELLKNKKQKIQELWDHLNFLFFFSVAQELNSDSFHGNFFHRLSLRIQLLEEKKSKEASRLKKTLLTLQQQCKAAEEIFCGKGLKSYSLLPEKIRLDIEQRLFERNPEYSIKNADTEEGRELLTAAIMASLSETMELTPLEPTQAETHSAF